jgi:4-amino-4-deoxy-L-arabinose transferase-like glycosyltransferase
MSIKFSHAVLLAVIYWAAIYLPGLASIEIKGEEIRRIMPGVNMLSTGNWIVPQFNGVPYLRKPPLVNWAIAASVKTFGVRDEWTARLPSVLAMLAMALVMLAACSPWLGPNAALAAVLITLTTAGLVEKGRLAEIEAIYIALFGMAFSCWLAWTATRRSRWLVWPVTGFLLGLGLLAKGPPHLAFFYAIACFIAWKSRRHKDSGIDTAFLSWAHLAGILIMAGLFALWWIPYSHDPATHGAGGVMARQMEQRIGGGDRSTIFLNVLRSLLNFLPWIIGLPLFWHRKTLALLQPRDRLIVEAARLPLVVCAFALMLLPGMLPRYTLPLVIPYTLLLVLVLKARVGDSVIRLPLAAATLAAICAICYGIFFAPRVAAHGYSRDFAAQINSQMPAGSPIYIFDPGVQPEVFYIQGQLLFTDSAKELPNDVPWLLAPDSAVKLLESRFQKSQVLAQPREQSGRQFVLLSLHGRELHPPKAPPKKPRPPTPPVAP